MNWYKGEIAEAITLSKSKGAIFVVYVNGTDEKSLKINDLINKTQVAKILGGDNFVAIQIEAESLSFQQFNQIYKQVSIPSLFFIGKQGLPLEIITEVDNVDQLLEKLNEILLKGGLKPIETETVINNEGQQGPSAAPDNTVCEDGICTIKKESELSVQEKIERAKQLVEQKREEKRQEELAKERQQEMERRKMGQNVQHMKRWQDDQSLKQLMEEREREKRESQRARDRVLAQIAQDKAERAAKFSSPSTSVPSSSTPQVPRAVNSNSARIQFRMPDGHTATNDFSSSETLNSVHNYIRANLKLPFSSYTLSTTFPRREFGENERNQTLLELGLVPTAVILILPLNSGTVSSGTTGGLSAMLWTVLTPIFTILGYLRTFIFGSAPPPETTRQQDKRDAPRSQIPQGRRPGETTVIRRQGNIHRLSNKNDSDDENNTWNGNSTQQM